MKVSAVIPAYNSEQYISKAIESILAQTVPVDEIIVVDDGSKDRTAEFASRYERTTVIRQPNAGQGPARNKAIAAASGEWIAFLDADDMWVPEKMAIQLQCIGPEIGVVYSNTYPRIDFGSLWHRQTFITPSGALVRKQTLADVGGFEESRAVKSVEDLHIWLKIALTDWQFAQSKPGLFKSGVTGQNESGNNYSMALAEMAGLQSIKALSGCDPREVQRLAQSVRIEYARNLIAEEKWDQAKEILKDAAPEYALSWLKLADFLKFNRLARRKFVDWLHVLDHRLNAYECTGECRLSEQKKAACKASARLPHHPLI